MALDYAAIMGASQQLVPDLAKRAMQQQELDAQTQQVRAQGAQIAEKLHRQQQYQSDLDHALLDGGPNAIQQLMLKYPEMADNIKPVWEAMDKSQRETDLTQSGTIYARAQSGDLKGAAELLRTRVEADKAAGKGDPGDQAILDGLESDDPVQQKAAMATIGMHIAAVTGPDKFAETYGKLNPQDKLSPFMKEYQDRVAQFGKKSADEWAALNDSKFIPVQAGGQVFQAGPTGYGPTGGTPPATAEGGDQSTAAPSFAMPVTKGSFAAADQQFGAKRDGGKRSHNGLDIAAEAGSPVTPVAPGKVVAVGNQPGTGGLFVRVKHPDGTITSYAHLGSQAVKVGQDVTPQTPLGTVGTTGNATGPVVHLVVRDKNGRAIDPRPLLGAPVHVASRQQADKLAPGTHYLTPDGREFVR